MALLQRTRILPNQRLDLPDYNNIESFVCADFAAIHQNVWTNENFVFSGFAATGTGTDTLSVALAGSSAVFGDDEGLMYIGASSLSALETTSLTPNAVNYVEIFLDQDSGGADSRAFWDQDAAGGDGGEFSQIVDTFIFQKATFSINTSNFSGDPDKLPLAEVTVDAGGIITAISDARPMFFRLGRPGNSTFAFNWANGRTAENPSSPSYNDPDKVINSLKSMFDALMDSIREIKGTTYWYEPPFTSLVGTFTNQILSTMTGNSASARFSWDGSALSITDDSPSGTPNADVIGYIRLFSSALTISFSRQDASSATISLSDGEVLWVEIPDPLSAINYSDVGASTSNYRVSPLGSVPVDNSTYWLAVREGTRLYVRGLGELEAGESVQVGDQISDELMNFIGATSDSDSTPPYTFTPSSDLPNSFTTSDSLTQAASINAENINDFASAVLNKYRETLTVTSAVAANDNEVQGPISSSTQLTIPLNGRDSNSTKNYKNGAGSLKVFRNGILQELGVDYTEDGAAGALVNTITIMVDLEVGERLEFEVTVDQITA